MRTRFGKFCSFLLLLGFLTAGISPACHFVSGKFLMEICTAEGDIKTVEVPVEDRQSRHAKKNSECMFCFASTNLKLVKASVMQVEASPGANYRGNGGGLFIPETLYTSHFKARAPPVPVV